VKPPAAAVQRSHRLAALLLGIALTLNLGSAGAQDVADVAAQIPGNLPAAATRLSAYARAQGAATALTQVYAARGNAPLWSHEGEVTPQARALLAQIEDAASYGLVAQDYGADALAAQLAALGTATASSAPLARFDAQLSAAALHFVSDLHFGRIAPAAAGFKLDAPRPAFDLAQVLQGIAAAPDVNAPLAAAEPTFYHYHLLKEARARYRTLAHQPLSLPLPPITAAVKVGGSYSGAAPLRALLTALGDLTPGAPPVAAADTTYDEALSEGVRSFQDRHGLTADGVLGKGTLAALNVPLAQRMRQIDLTLERWRWLPPFKSPPIIVNIPQFQLFAFRTTEDRAADILQMAVIVGRTYAHTQTPVFEGDMRYVVLRPYWDVPSSIVRNEMLPKIRANPGYLARQHLELVNGQSDSSPVVPPTPDNLELLAAGKLRLRQQPGEDNALGLAKFMFPNHYNVYLHSTPAHALFKETVRAFSHGCIRVADPVALALLVLKNAPGDWTREKIQAAMNGSNALRVNLSEPIQVLILYGTALATEEGPVLFFEDIYGYDQKLERQLKLASAR
jgi:murein L,D-transpeptidase YcbB/YkuD